MANICERLPHAAGSVNCTVNSLTLPLLNKAIKNSQNPQLSPSSVKESQTKKTSRISVCLIDTDPE